ncbi:MAG: LacI family DNA-binding transcriptional regulator [Anaerolineaceae bacterium]
MSTLIEVAKLANVSVTTASRVLSGSTHPVSEEKRLCVLQAARDLDYSPSPLAQAMVTGSTHIVGVIVGDATDPYFAWIVRGVEDVARACGYLVIVCNSDRVPEVELSYLKTLNDYKVDGVIFAGGGLTDENYLSGMRQMIQIFQDRNAVFVSLGKHLFPSFPVIVDNRGMVQTAVEFLIRLGHRRIAYISGPELLTTTEERLAGYKETLIKNKIEPDESLILSGDYKYQSGIQAATDIHSMNVKPTAVLASNDVMAIACITGLKDLKYSIPEDISVMGIDNIPFARFVDPPLTTVALPMYEMGKVGMESLIKLLNGEKIDHSGVALSQELVIRKSTAPIHIPQD